MIAIDWPPELQPSGNYRISLPGGSDVELPVCKPVFQLWTGDSKMFDYGGKTILQYGDEACYAELIILRSFLKSGWDGVWVETFGGPNYLRTMPSGWKLKPHHVPIPPDKEQLLRRIWATAKSYACFDVFTWKGDRIVFCEAKRAQKDRLTKPQFKFIEAAIACGISANALLIVDWTLAA